MIVKKFLVDKTHSAEYVGSGSLAVLSTPTLIAFVENTCFEYTQRKLSDEKTTVGTRVDLKHLKATKIGATIEVRLLTIEENDRKFVFEFEVLEGSQIIGKGYHKRAIVNKKEFLRNI